MFTTRLFTHDNYNNMTEILPLGSEKADSASTDGCLPVELRERFAQRSVQPAEEADLFGCTGGSRAFEQVERLRQWTWIALPGLKGLLVKCCVLVTA